MRTIAFYTLGCKVNQADTASMEQLFLKADYKLVDFSDKADVYLINTCVVTNMGQSKSRKIIHRAVRQNPQALIVVTGCYPQTAPEEVAAIEGVDLIVGNQDRKNIVELVTEAQGKSLKEPANKVHALTQDTAFEEMSAGVDAAKTRAFLKIQEGCNQFCTYCIIPYARGPLRSRSLESIKIQVEQLVAEGYKEVVLLGIHLGAYGRELVSGPKLVDAVEAALSVAGLQRLRLGSLESIEVEPKLLDIMLRDERLCRHLHLPLQAGCDKTLKAMHRPYDTARFAKLLRDIRSKVADVAITTDLIVGFPNETEEDFQCSLAFAEQCEFSKIHIFPYSKRKGTPAEAMEQQVPEQTKQLRVAQAEQVDDKCHQAFVEGIIGTEQRALWEIKNKEGLWEGFTPNYIRVYTHSDAELGDTLTTIRLEKGYKDGALGVII